MIFPTLRGEDRMKLAAPDEGRRPFDQERENALIDDETDEARDEEDRESERRRA